MKRTCSAEEQIVAILKAAKAGAKGLDMARSGRRR
jgi:hypothetical protein